MDSLTAKREKLLSLIRGLGRCAVAFSGGVDSAVVAAAAHEALGDGAVAVTGVSPSLPAGELQEAQAVARAIGIRHEIVATEEFQSDEYLRNAPDRCYHCKTELYTQLEELAERVGADVILNGANADDAGDYRPGMQAAREHRVFSPLLECGITKAEVRELAAQFGLSVWDKPAGPCLASRIAYGEEVTEDRVAMIDRAERFLRERGFRQVRVRYHKGDLARVEVPADQLDRLAQEPLRGELVRRLTELGFKYVTIDLLGFRSGSLNAVLPVEKLLA
ncbi:MAG: ATP-dependent sacrificial sulfur transferase LarE, partial [Planctomycetia bacterium]|nr:ATP-dependent sacrificial sulfur transferase LarE [Planctomycetia bacterium]